MARLIVILGLGFLVTLGLVLSAPSTTVKAQTLAAGVTLRPASDTGGNVLGGPRGIVKTPKGQAVDGLMVQLVAQKTAIRTTVYTDELGRYEFPKLESGTYTLRLARPLEYQRYQRDGVHIDGMTHLEDIVVDRVAPGEFLPPTADIMPQLTGAEWIANMPGSAFEKKTFLNACGAGCHSLDYPFRVRYDEEGWRKLIYRMTGYTYRTLVPPIGRGGAGVAMGEYGSRGGESLKVVANWLSRVRGLDSEVPALKPFPRPVGAATRAIVTEYEIPWELQNIHDVAGDREGNLWFTINRAPFIGKLDPTTGKVTQYRVPAAPPLNIRMRGGAGSDAIYRFDPKIGLTPGLHWIEVDQTSGIVWATDTWSQALYRLDPRSGDFQVVNTGLFGNIALSPDGAMIGRLEAGRIRLYDTKTVMQTGKPVKEIPTTTIGSTYGNFFSRDGRYFGGAGSQIFRYDLQTEELRELSALSPDVGSARGDFDPEGNLWGGGKGGKLVKYNPKSGVIGEYAPPTPFVNFYTARADKNGEIWAGEMSGGRVARFNPRTHQWIEYVLPSPYGFDFNSWIDNSTNPPTFWYGDQYGFITRVQPLQ